MKEILPNTKNTPHMVLTLSLVWLTTIFLLNTLFSSVTNAVNDISYIQTEQKKLTEIHQTKIKFENELRYKQSQVYLSNRALTDLGYSDPTASIYFIKDETESSTQTIELRTEILFPEDNSSKLSNLENWLKIFLN